MTCVRKDAFHGAAAFIDVPAVFDIVRRVWIKRFAAREAMVAGIW